MQDKWLSQITNQIQKMAGAALKRLMAEYKRE